MDYPGVKAKSGHEMEYKNVEVRMLEEDGSIACVTINRPHKLNAVNAETLSELDSVFSVDLRTRIAEIKCVILRGAGTKSFTSGLDLSCPSTSSVLFSPSLPNPNEQSEYLFEKIKAFQRPIMSIQSFPRPVICSIDGVCFGLGVDLACACDIRIASESSNFSVREVKIGICADLGSLYFMPKICRSDSWVREVCFTGRTFSGREAFHNGFISDLVGETLSFDKSIEIAKMIASNEASAVLGTRHHLNVSSRKGIHSAFDKVAFWNSIKLQDTESVTRAVRKIFKSKL